MDELTIGDKVYISSKRAAKITGYAKDYVGQLCREGRVEARLVGRNWYVLESSIHEHRFGSEEQTMVTAESKVVPSSSVPVSTWKEPEYFAEVPAFIPVLSLKPEPQEQLRGTVVADMQSAWHEWFAGKKEESEESVVPVEESPVEEELVHITRIEEPEEAAEEEIMVGEPEEVEITRIKEPVVEEVLQSPHAYEETVESIEEEQPQYQALRVSKRVAGSSVALKSLFVAVALAAMVVAVIGSGNATPLLRHGSAGVFQPFIQYLEGTSTYEQSSK